MTLTSDLKAKYCGLWELMTYHRFVSQLGDGSLSPRIFKTYFLQDYVFVNDLVVLAAQALAKAPDMKAASIFNDFLTGVLDPENDLFMRFFNQLGASEEDYSSVKASPTTQAFGDFLVRTSLEGTFDEIVLVLYVTEGTYLDWGTRLTEEKVNATNPVFREWIDLHGPEVLGDLVSWLENYINNDSSISPERADYLFHTALRYEFLFWESAYNDELWFDV